MIAIVSSERLESPEMGTLNRILDRTIHPATGQKIPDIPILRPENFQNGDVGVVIDESSFQALTGWSGKDSLRGYVFEAKGRTNAHVVPTYAPERIRKGGWNLAKVVQRDVLRAFAVEETGPPTFSGSYVTYPSPEEFAAFMAGWDPVLPLAFDIETPYSETKDENMSFDEDPSYTVLMVSLAYEPHRAISVPWSPPYDEQVRAYLGSAARSLVWNAPFDVPRLQANGVDFSGEVVDVMLMWHWLEPGLPMGLKFVAPFYCVTPDTRVLTANLDWVPAGNLRKGSKLLAVDEERRNGAMGRRYVPSTVLATRREKAEVLAVHFNDGTSVKTTPEHPWLKRDGNSTYKWFTTAELKAGDKLRRLMDVWDYDESREAGWLSGMFDGEGTLSWGRSPKLGVAQNNGPTLEYLKDELRARDFSWTEAEYHNCVYMNIAGGIPEYLRFLGTIKPERLLEKFDIRELGDIRSRKEREVEIVDITSLGEMEIQRMETSSHTFIAEGFAMHNCPEMPAWKLEQESNFAWYNAADSDTLLRCYFGILKELEDQQRWKTFERHFLDYGKVLRRLSRRGVLVDQQSRAASLREFEGEYEGLTKRVQPLVPDEVKPVHPKRGYKGDEASLRKKGSWVEGRMRSIKVVLNDADVLAAQRKLATSWNSEINKGIQKDWTEARKAHRRYLKGKPLFKEEAQ